MNITDIKDSIIKLEELNQQTKELNNIAQKIANQELYPTNLMVNLFKTKKDKKDILDSDGSLVLGNKPTGMFRIVFYGQEETKKDNDYQLNLKLNDIQILSILGVLLQQYEAEKKQIIKFLTDKNIKL